MQLYRVAENIILISFLFFWYEEKNAPWLLPACLPACLGQKCTLFHFIKHFRAGNLIPVLPWRQNEPFLPPPSSTKMCYFSWHFDIFILLSLFSFLKISLYSVGQLISSFIQMRFSNQKHDWWPVFSVAQVTFDTCYRRNRKLTETEFIYQPHQKKSFIDQVSNFSHKWKWNQCSNPYFGCKHLNPHEYCIATVMNPTVPHGEDKTFLYICQKRGKCFLTHVKTVGHGKIATYKFLGFFPIFCSSFQMRKQKHCLPDFANIPWNIIRRVIH